MTPDPEPGPGPLIQDVIKGLQIQSDGRTVWVNGPEGCLARLCQISYEILITGTHWIVTPCRDECWPMFLEDVEERFAIRIPSMHKPGWA